MNDEERQTTQRAGLPAGSDMPLAVVGLGVCAHSLPTFRTIFAELDAPLGAAYLVAVRQNEGLGVATVLEALQGPSTLQVGIAQDGEALAPDRVHVCGPDDMMTIVDGHLRVRPAAEPVGHRGTVDTLLISLAEHAHERSVVVILSGLGREGTAGVAATKRFGGLSIAELAPDQQPSGNGAGPFGVADLHLPAGAIAGQIRRYVSSLEPIGSADEDPPADIEAHLTQIVTILRNVTGNDFHGYKRGTFIRRVQSRMQVLQIDTIKAYVDQVRADREEVQNLFQDLLIGVTQFFRDPAGFEVLEAEIPRLFEGKGPDDRLRVWVLGCATGEEAYSIAILLREQMARLDNPPDVQILATDLDARALGIARAGRYPAGIATHVRPDRLARWFIREGDTCCVSRELREMCIFSPHNVVKDAPFSRIDLLSCRNLLIYLTSDLQDRIMPIFHFALRPGGVLFLGSCQNVTRHSKLFESVDRKNRVFRKLETAARIIPGFPLTPRARSAGPFGLLPDPAMSPARPAPSVNRQAEAVAERYAPSYVVVDTQGDVLHFSGRTGRYFDPAAGAASLNLMSLVHRDLHRDVRSALQRAVDEAERVEIPGVLMRRDDRTHAVTIIVEPLGGGDITSLMVLFQEAGIIADATLADGGRLTNDEHVQRLENDLRVTRDRLQATIEELEATNEELKSSNEEYQSINEELQSANEEMETSKEELRSANEELRTVNGELTHRVSELDRANSDLKNLLEATRIATVFLDNDLRVRNFTPAATEIFHLLDTDVGRPLDHVVSRVSYPDLHEDIRRVLKSLAPIERQVSSHSGDRHYAARVLPYRSVDNYISGAVVTFTDRTAVHSAEAALRQIEQRLQRVLETEAVGVIFFDHDGTMLSANDVFLRMSGYSRARIEAGELTWRKLTPPEHLAESERQMDILERTGRIGPYEKEYFMAGGSRRWMLFAGRDLGDGTRTEFCIDISGRKTAEAALRKSEEQFRAFGEASSDVLWIRDADSLQWVYLTPAFETIHGLDRSGAMNGNDFRTWTELIVPEDRERALEHIRSVRGGARANLEYRIRRLSDREIRWLRTTDFPLFGEDGTVRRIGGIGRDITEERSAAKRMEVLAAELQHRTRNLMGVIRSVADKTLRSSANLADFEDHFQGRLDVLARVQGLLSRLSEGDRVTFDELLRSELAAHGAQDGRSSALVLDGPPGVRLRSSTVQILALALHELATNAVKYGALGQSAAQLAIRWSVDAPDGPGKPWLCIDWRETGVDLAQRDPAFPTSGQGRELIEQALPYQLGARTTYSLNDDGAHCTIAVPLTSRDHAS